MQGFDVQFQRKKATLDITIKMAPSNYFRMGAIEEEFVSKGTEFVVAKDDLDSQSFPKPKRGDTIISTVHGNLSVTKVNEMVALGELIGYRLRCG